MPPKITLIGAGSTVFAKNLVGDILSFPELADATLTLFDIDEKRLELSTAVAHRIASKLGVDATIIPTTDRERALDGADYALNMIQVGGYRPATVTDFDIPKKFGLRQTIGDTLGIGGIMRALRTIPVLLDMQRDMERLCPDVLHLNYVNPMAMVVWALRQASPINTVGLCHSVQGTAAELARDVGVPENEVDYLAAGINHMAFYLKFERQGRDLYPDLHKVLDEGRVPNHNRVRYEMLRRLGYFVTESSEHFSEYVPWFIKRDRPELIERCNIPLDEYPGRCEVYEIAWRFIERELQQPGSQSADELRRALEEADIDVMPGTIDHTVRDFRSLNDVSRSHEYGSYIIHSVETGTPRVVYGNVPNDGLIDNLPGGCCVEVPCLVDKNGIQPTRIGTLPPQLAALMRTNINVQELTVAAALTGNRDHVYHAAMLDPHTAAELGVDEIYALVDELIEAHGDFIPDDLRQRSPELV
ncbi:MAG: alpha-glucosidase/alpha-galactosidase [Trueperaceae bacterium]|nr:alpha-glucosidase/alpha-galactosidase [Trueperaceae bacterium]